MGGPPRSRVKPRPTRRLEVAVKAMDLRFLSQPILLGHYQQDPIAGAEALVDRELLDGELSQRYNLGLYAGPRGTATVVLRSPSEQERRQGSLGGAVVAGLGAYDGALSPDTLTEAVRNAVLRYLLHMVDVLGKEERELPLAALLLGYNSSLNLSVAASVEALTRGVIDANARFREATRLGIRVASLQIIELYLDTAITAVYALRQMPGKLEALARRQGTTLVCRPELEQGEGLRHRLFDRPDQSYWPRLIVTDADRHDDDCPPAGFVAPGDGGSGDGVSRTPIAERLRYLYVGRRARAETLAHQRQPGLIEMLVRQQIHSALWQENLGRMLFQLMVPHEFKDAARQLERIVLVVDAYTANLPWELMSADDSAGEGERLPLAMRGPVVRQLSSSRFRRQVRQCIQRSALVVGNPSVEGFAAAFPDPRQMSTADPPSLPGAETEAIEVMRLLGGLGYQVVGAIGGDQRACDVLVKLLQQPYRLVHISAHGIFDQRHRDGLRRSGVVLSDGLLITAAEIAAMETVPELVFLNCCHLGKVDPGEGERTRRDANRLAASLARELIEIGVRCVVVAGWSVNDAGALVFGQRFYQGLLQDGLPFGEALFLARKAVWDRDPGDITWGAFQAYGDPGWLAESRGGGTTEGGDRRYVSPDELVDDLDALRATFAGQGERRTGRDHAKRARKIRRLLEKRCPAGWGDLPQVQAALAAAWAELGELDEARRAYLAAIRSEDNRGRVPIRAIEQLADIEARLGEDRLDPELIKSALDRLTSLDSLVAPEQGAEGTRGHGLNAERGALRASALKRKAGLHALKALDPKATDATRAREAESMIQALEAAAEAYGHGAGEPGSQGFRPYSTLNRLALQALRMPEEDPQRAAAIALAQRCRPAAGYGGVTDPGVATLEADALLVERLLDGGLAAAGEEGKRALEEVARAYREAPPNLRGGSRGLDSLLSQLCRLSRFGDALYRKAGDLRHRRLADALIALAEQLQPGTCKRDDRPAPGEESATPTPAPRRRRSARPRPQPQ